MAARVPSAALLVLYFHMEIEALPWSYAFGLVPHAGLRSAAHAPLFAQRHDGRKRIKSQGLLLCQAEKKPLLCCFVHFLQNKSYSFVGFRKIVYFSLTMSIDNLFAPVLQ